MIHSIQFNSSFYSGTPLSKLSKEQCEAAIADLDKLLKVYHVFPIPLPPKSKLLKIKEYIKCLLDTQHPSKTEV